VNDQQVTCDGFGVRGYRHAKNVVLPKVFSQDGLARVFLRCRVAQDREPHAASEHQRLEPFWEVSRNSHPQFLPKHSFTRRARGLVKKWTTSTASRCVMVFSSTPSDHTQAIAPQSKAKVRVAFVARYSSRRSRSACSGTSHPPASAEKTS
jgi:hypothetical protein